VDGDFVKCLVGNDTIVYATIPEDTGGVGIKIWDKNIGMANINLKEFNLYDAQFAHDNIASLPSYDKNVTKHLISKEESGVDQPIKVTISVKEEQKPKPITTPVVEDKSLAITLPYKPEILVKKDWKNVFGLLSDKDNILIFGTNASTTSSQAVLIGSQDWTNYKFNVLLTWSSGSSATLVARYKDQKNYVACSFGEYGSSVRLYKVVNGVSKTVAQSPRLPYPSIEAWKDNNFSISVDKNAVSCLKDGEWIVRGDLEDIPLSGSVGIKTYDRINGHAQVKVSSLSVFTN
jgi:hypothetical protein